MYVIRSANGNIYPVDRSVFRIAEVSTGGYKLTHFTANAGSVATNANPAAQLQVMNQVIQVSQVGLLL